MREPTFVDEQVTRVLPSTSTERVYSTPVPEGRHWRLTRVSVENETSSATSFRIFTEHGSVRRYWRQQGSPAADTVYTDPDPLHLQSNARLGVEYAGHSLNDRIILNFQGFEVDNPWGWMMSWPAPGQPPQ